MKNKIGVIGSGIGGLAAAIRLSCKGYQVEVFEKNGYIGGKIGEFTRQGFRFDMGPSLFTMPRLIDELFILAGKKPEENFRYLPLHSSCKYFYADGKILTAYTNGEAFATEISEKTGVAGSTLSKYLNKSKQLYKLTQDVFIFSSLHKFGNYFSPTYLKAYPGFARLDAFITMHNRNRQVFKDTHVTQLFDRYATYVGSDPYRAPATLNMISHLEHNTGAFFPEKGMYSIVQSLHQLAQELGVVFHMNTEVEKVTEIKKDIKEIQSSNGISGYNYIISNSDVYFSNRRLFGNQIKTRDINRSGLSSSALIFYWGINRQFKEMDLHNVLFSSDYEGEFNAIFREFRIFNDPTVYIFISSKIVAGDAPEGMENWFVMINVPTGDPGEKKDIIHQARINIIAKINTMLATDIEKHIIFEEKLSPDEIEKRTYSYRGALYGINSNSRFAAFNRHPNFSRKMKGLYFAGGSVHPGGGIPMCLASASIVSDEFKPVR